MMADVGFAGFSQLRVGTRFREFALHGANLFGLRPDIGPMVNLRNFVFAAGGHTFEAFLGIHVLGARFIERREFDIELRELVFLVSR